jgi:hypothetical protein
MENDERIYTKYSVDWPEGAYIGFNPTDSKEGRLLYVAGPDVTVIKLPSLEISHTARRVDAYFYWSYKKVNENVTEPIPAVVSEN